MDTLLDEPALVLVVLSLAAALLVIEVALPTMGVAGSLALGLGLVGAVAVAHQDATWWPLVGLKLAVVLWAVLIARRERSRAVEVLAVVLFAGGSVLFGAIADSPATAALGVAVAVGLGAGYPNLHARARRLLDQPARTGMESLTGQSAEVVRWEGTAGTVRHAGSLWNATSTQELTAGDPVAVVGHTGTTLAVAPRVTHTS